MGIRRLKTQSSHLGVLDLDDYEFDPGFLGLCQRFRVSSRNAIVRLYRALRFFITSFLGLHYIYIISWSLVLSWILYPQRNMTYTDALFQAVSAMTLTGLNSVDLNRLKLYQQIFLFVTPIFTHPLTIASFMVFYRLYLYRKKFEDIENTSKFQSKIRRAATVSQYETMRKAGREQSQAPQNINLQLSRPSDSPPDAELDNKDSSSKSSNDPYEADDIVKSSNDETSGSRNNGSKESSRMNKRNTRVQASNTDNDDLEPNKIRFGALPRPPSRERVNDPQEMFRSLNIMRNQNLGDEMDEDDGPALVIKSPRDIEADELRGIHSAVVDTNNQSDMYANNYTNNPGHHHMRRMSTATMSDSGFRAQRTLTRADTLMSMASARTPKSMTANYLSWTPTVGRNSAFIGLTREQKEELGGVEYRSLKMLRWVTLSYFITLLCLGWLFIIPWVYKQKKYEELIQNHGVSPVLFAITTVLSAFNNSGLCILPTSITEFWHSAYVPVVLTFLVMAGNVAIPIILRYSVYIVFRLSPRFGQTRETLGFLLDHPRRCFMLLFPSTTTWWLTLTIFLFIIVEVSFFMILDHGDHSPHTDIAAGPRLLLAYFQSIAVRTVGFTMIDISTQAPGMLILNIVMMYIAIYPVAMSIRKSNVYEEQTLGHYYTAPTKSTGYESSFADNRSISSNAIEDDDNNNQEDRNNISFMQRLRRLSTLTGDRIRSGENDNNVFNDVDEYENDDEDEDDRPSTLVDHMRRQLSMDIWSLVLGLMLIAITEGGRITRGEFSMFNVIFEVVSAHGTIGWSMGLSGTTVSCSGGFSNLGKLVMIAIMIRGRHRAMPYNIDRAIILKGADILRRDKEQENRIRDARVMTYREPSENSSWFPRTATSASRFASFGTTRNRSSLSRHNTQRSTENQQT